MDKNHVNRSYSLDPKFSLDEIHGELVVVNSKTGEYHILNETGKFIVDAVATGASPEAIANELTSEFDIDLESANRDVAGLCKQLNELGIIRISE